MNKYERFCTELKEFCFKINITTPELFKGETEENIIQFEKKNNLKIPEGFRSVLKYSGGSLLFYNCISLEVNNTINNIEYAIRYNNDNQFLKNIPLIDSKLNNILPIDYYIESSVMSFISLDEENPRICSYYGDDGELDEDDLIISSTWINQLRNIVFCELINKLKHKAYNQSFGDSDNNIIDRRYERRLQLKTDDVNWASIYVNAYKKGFDVNWDWYREEFEEIATEIENREDRILGIDEFEWTFIDYLREKGEL